MGAARPIGYVPGLYLYEAYSHRTLLIKPHLEEPNGPKRFISSVTACFSTSSP